MTRPEYEQRMRDLLELARSPGWKTYEQMIEGLVTLANHKLTTEKDPYEMVRAQAALRVLRDLATWPMREAAAIREHLTSQLPET